MAEMPFVYQVRIRGELACFTRPELKVERVSYEVITPSAARGIIEAVLWKPAIRWKIRRILLLAPVRFIQFRRNEVNSRISTRAVSSAENGSALRPFFADEDRAQRNTVALRDVDYVVEAEFVMTDKRGPNDNPLKFDEMFRRRLEKGQACHFPYLGCREFPATIQEYNGQPGPVAESRDFGWMLHDIRFGKRNEPIFFHAQMHNGVVNVPDLAVGGGS
jgi:CRISPR-associated protein Cas5d